MICKWATSICSASLVIREMQSKTTMRFHFTSVRIDTIKKKRGVGGEYIPWGRSLELPILLIYFILSPLLQLHSHNFHQSMRLPVGYTKLPVGYINIPTMYTDRSFMGLLCSQTPATILDWQYSTKAKNSWSYCTRYSHCGPDYLKYIFLFKIFFSIKFIIGYWI